MTVLGAMFAHFAAARRSVAHPLHQAYVQDHSSKVVGQRGIVHHESAALAAPEFIGA